MSGTYPPVVESGVSSTGAPGGRLEWADEGLERFAAKMIEKAMTSVVVRLCWSCQRRFVKTTGCNEVTCVCGAVTCHRCGGRIDGTRHMCSHDLPPPTLGAVYRAARAARLHLRLRYPSLRFKYDPSRRRRRFRGNRYRRRNMYQYNNHPQTF